MRDIDPKFSVIPTNRDSSSQEFPSSSSIHRLSRMRGTSSSAKRTVARGRTASEVKAKSNFQASGYDFTI